MVSILNGLGVLFNPALPAVEILLERSKIVGLNLSEHAGNPL